MTPRYDRHFIQYVVRETSRRQIQALGNLLLEYGISLRPSYAPQTAFYNPEIAGAYLAGLIDGDGCIQLRKSYEGNRPERLIKIASNVRPPLESVQLMLQSLELPDGYISQYQTHADLWIFLGKDFQRWLRDFVKPHLSIVTKRQRLT